MDNIRDLMTRYNRAQQASLETTSLRKQLVPMLKGAGLTKTKFDFGDRTISYHVYSSYEELTQKLIKKVIADKYPQIDPDQFVKDVYAARAKKSVETLQVVQGKSGEKK